MHSSIPPDILDTVDELLLSRNFFAAILRLREHTGCPLYSAVELLMSRSAALEELHPAFAEAEATRRWRETSPDAWRATARQQLAALPVPPVALEVLWDGDSTGWYLDVSAILPSASAEHPRFTCVCLVRMRSTGFEPHQGPDREVALELARSTQEKWGCAFYFPSPDERTTDSPRWWDTQLTASPA